MSDCNNYFLICHDAGLKKSTPKTIILSRLTFLHSDTREHVMFHA